MWWCHPKLKDYIWLTGNEGADHADRAWLLSKRNEFVYSLCTACWVTGMGRGLPVSIPLGGAWLTGSSPHLYPILFSITLFTPSLRVKLEVPLRQQNRGTPFQSAQTWFLLAQFCLQEIEITKGTHSPFGSWLYGWPYCFQARPDILRYREAHGKKGKNREFLSPPDGWGHNNPMTHVSQSSGRTLSHPGGAGPRSSPTDWMLDPCRPQQWPIPRLTRKPFG